MTSFAATERNAGSDFRRVDTTARRFDGGYVLDGRKEYSSNIRYAGYVIVVARLEGSGERDGSGLSWFLVPMDSPGVTIGEHWPTLGLRAMDLSPVDFMGSTAQSRTGLAMRVTASP